MNFSPVEMFCSSRQLRRSSRQKTPVPFTCWRAPSEGQHGGSDKKFTEGGKISGYRHILTGWNLFSEGLIIGGNFVFQNGLGLTVITANSNSPWACIQEGLLSEGYMCL